MGLLLSTLSFVLLSVPLGSSVGIYLVDICNYIIKSHLLDSFSLNALPFY